MASIKGTGAKKNNMNFMTMIAMELLVMLASPVLSANVKQEEFNAAVIIQLEGR